MHQQQRRILASGRRAGIPGEHPGRLALVALPAVMDRPHIHAILPGWLTPHSIYPRLFQRGHIPHPVGNGSLIHTPKRQHPDQKQHE